MVSSAALVLALMHAPTASAATQSSTSSSDRVKITLKPALSQAPSKAAAKSQSTTTPKAGSKTEPKEKSVAATVKSTAHTAATKATVVKTSVKPADATPKGKTKPSVPTVTSKALKTSAPAKVAIAASEPQPSTASAPDIEPTPAMNAAPLPYQQIAATVMRPQVSQPQLQTPKAAPVDNVLSEADAQLYRSAFASVDAGRFDEADRSLAQVTDKSLMGYAQYHKLFSRNYTSTYGELTDWLAAYGDLPVAMNVWNLAKRKKPAGSDDPAFPSLGNAVPAQAKADIRSDSDAVQLSGLSPLDAALKTAANAGPGIDDGSELTPKSARSAYNNGQLEQAVTLARKIGDHWVAGLALWRLNRFDQAETEFKFVSTDPSRNAWSQSGGAYWAGRCAAKQGRDDDASTYFKIAASFPFTFYGLVAEARLGVTPAIALAKKGLTPTFDGVDRTALSASLDSDFSWTRDDPKAVRLNALVQVGRDGDAQKELQAAVQTASNADEREQWLALAAKTNVPISQLKPADRLFDASKYPMPDFAPKGGYRVDKALIYAFARKESKFNAKAHSYSGAYGLLQLMPATAANITGDSSFATKPAQLLAPEVNLKVGQDYIQRLSTSSLMSGDLLRTIGAYNAGPRPIKDAVDSLGKDADSLLMMESIPVAQTRQYVEEVAANYWIYRQLMGKSSKTLALAAADARIIDASADN